MDLRSRCLAVALIGAGFALNSTGCGKDETPAPPAAPEPSGASAPQQAATTSAAPAVATASASADARAPGATATGGTPSGGSVSATAPQPKPPVQSSGGTAASAPSDSSGKSGAAPQAAPAAAASGGPSASQGSDDVGGTDSKDPETRRLALLARDARFAPYRRLAKERLAAQMKMATFQADTSSEAALESSRKEYERLRAEYAARSESMDKFMASQKWSDEDYAVMGFIMAQVESSRTSK